MSKILISPPNLTNLKELYQLTDAFLIGVKDFSLYLPCNVEICDLDKIIKEIKDSNKEIFISLNKLMYNKDLNTLENILISLDNKVDGVLFDDFSVYNICKRLNLNINLIWASTQLVTNYKTIDSWYERGVVYSLLSSNITLNEILETSELSKAKLIVPIYGFVPIFSSVRKLVSNFSSHIKKHLDDNSYNLYDKSNDNFYPIYEDSLGTHIMSNSILNGIKESLILKDKVDYLYLNGFLHNNSEFIQILKYFIKADNNNKDDLYKFINDIGNIKKDTGFLYKETIFRVKKND